MDRTEILKVVTESLNEENSIMDKKYEVLIGEIQSLTKKIDALYEKIEQAEKKYSSFWENNYNKGESNYESIVPDDNDIGINNVNSVKSDASEQKASRIVIDKYTNNLAERVNYCLRPYYYDENQKNSDIFSIESDIHEGNAERYMLKLNTILESQNLTDEMVNYISEIIVDLAEYVADEPEKEKVEETEISQNNIVGTMFGEHDKVDSQNIENESMSNVFVHIEENVNTVTDEITTHYKKLDSGIFFADWVNTQKMDFRIKDALASIDYIIDDVARKPDTSIIVDDNGVLGIQTSKGTNFYKDEQGGNKISAFLIDIKSLMENDIYTSAIINCYDAVRSVEREQFKSKKKDLR